MVVVVVTSMGTVQLDAAVAHLHWHAKLASSAGMLSLGPSHLMVMHTK